MYKKFPVKSYHRTLATFLQRTKS